MPNDFVRNPGGNSPTPPKPRSFVEVPPELATRKKYDGFETDQKSAKAGGLSPLDAVTPTQDPGNPIGTSVSGRSRAPFKLNG